MKDARIIINRLCETCNGTSWGPSAPWKRFWEEHNGQKPTDQQVREWFANHGFWELPAEEETCPECRNGRISEEITLRQLRDLLWSEPCMAKEEPISPCKG